MFNKALHTLLIVVAAAAFTACTEKCNIDGNSTVGSLDGRMLYLRIDDGVVTAANVDSCQVVHGRFRFFSDIDTIVMAQLCMGSERIMPVVLENGDLSVKVDHVLQRVSGGPLNDRLYRFLQKKNRIENQQWELDQQAMRMLHEGSTVAEIKRTIMPKAERLAKELEKLEVKFIRDNFNNPLGAGCFAWLFGQYPHPVLTPQITKIIDGAPQSFLSNPFVSDYMRRARGTAAPSRDNLHNAGQ